MLKSAPNELEDLLDRRRPGWSLDQAFYINPAVFQAELEAVFRQYWLYAGHISQIPRPGDYVLYELQNESVIVMRESESEVAALANVCRHRGSRICTEPSGHAKKLVCPYHQWVYGRGGDLLAAKHMPPDFDKEEFGLHRLACRVLEGLIFVSFSPSPPDFSAIARDVKPQLAPHNLARARMAHQCCFPLRANWKLAMENWRECYHCAGAHPEFCRITGANRTFSSDAGRAEYRAREAAKQAFWRSNGIPVERINPDPPNVFYSCNRFSLLDGYVTESLDGQPVSRLMSEPPLADMGTFGFNLFPIFSVQAHSDYAFIVNMKPVSMDETHYECSWLVHEAAVEGRDYQLDELVAFWMRTSEQDVGLIEANQRGVDSNFYRPGPYSMVEVEHIELFLRYYLDALERGLRESAPSHANSRSEFS